MADAQAATGTDEMAALVTGSGRETVRDDAPPRADAMDATTSAGYHNCPENTALTGPVADHRPPGGVAERLKAPVLKTGEGLCLSVGSNPTPTASL